MTETEKEIMEMVDLIKVLPPDVRKKYLTYLRTLVNKQSPVSENPLVKTE